ncbi:MAG: hypothetical protein ACXVCM_26420 [Ktedonobacteraceae bacterium]
MLVGRSITSWFDQASASDARCIPPIRNTADLDLPKSREGIASQGTQSRFGLLIIAYVRLPEGFVYLACILDIYSRTCIGWSLSRRIDAQLPLQAACDGIGESIRSPPG